MKTSSSRAFIWLYPSTDLCLPADPLSCGASLGTHREADRRGEPTSSAKRTNVTKVPARDPLARLPPDVAEVVHICAAIELRRLNGQATSNAWSGPSRRVAAKSKEQ